MTALDLAHHSAELFAWLWRGHREPWFLQYVEQSCGVPVSELPRFEGVILSEAEEGTAERGWVQSLVRRWWFVDDRGFRTVKYSDLPPFAVERNQAADAGRLYYRWPSVHFFAEGDRLAFYEKLGPELLANKTGREEVRGAEVVITDVRLLWTLRRPSGLSLPPIRPEFEITPRGPGCKTKGTS